METSDVSPNPGDRADEEKIREHVLDAGDFEEKTEGIPPMRPIGFRDHAERGVFPAAQNDLGRHDRHPQEENGNFMRDQSRPYTGRTELLN